MTDPKIIPLSPDDTQNKIDGTPDPLEPAGDVTIERPDAPVNIGPNMVEVDGVFEDANLEKSNN